MLGKVWMNPWEGHQKLREILERCQIDVLSSPWPICITSCAALLNRKEGTETRGGQRSDTWSVCIFVLVWLRSGECKHVHQWENEYLTTSPRLVGWEQNMANQWEMVFHSTPFSGVDDDTDERQKNSMFVLITKHVTLLREGEPTHHDMFK